MKQAFFLVAILAASFISPCLANPDVSTQPIPADEPIPASGMPPLPNSLDLPGSRRVDAFNPYGQPNRPTSAPVRRSNVRPTPASRPRPNTPQQVPGLLPIDTNSSEFVGPKLNQPSSQASAPTSQAPRGVPVYQSSSQDLTLSDDDNRQNPQRKRTLRPNGSLAPLQRYNPLRFLPH